MNYRYLSFYFKSIAIFLLMKMAFFQCEYLQASPDSTNVLQYINRVPFYIIDSKLDTLIKRIQIGNDPNANAAKDSIYIKIQKNAQKN